MKAPRTGIQALGLAALVIVIFYPVISAPLNPVDDRAIVQWLHDTEGSGAWKILTHATDYFYRPVLLATYLLDMKLWGAETSFLHLENILLHAANTLLLFACARIVVNRFFDEAIWPPFLAALLFSIHPVNTEAVNWIAARSDLLAGFFVLIAAMLLLYGLATIRPLYAYLSVLPLAPGFFSKETAVFFVPAALAIILLFEEPRPASPRPKLIERVKERLPFLFPFLILPLFYIAVRGGLARDAGAGLVRQFIGERELGLTTVLQTIFTGFGFYFKKLLIPWPLNFTIFEVPGYYFWVGLAVFLLLVYCVFKWNIIGGLFLASACVGTSAIVVMLLSPAWTPAAERYLYLPSAFFCLALVIVGHRLVLRFSFPRAVPLVLTIFFAATASATVHRNLVWQDNVHLFEDSVRKSPNFPFARSVLASLLMESRREAEGVAIIRSNTAPEGLRNADFLDLKRAELLLHERKYEEARALIMDKRQRKGQLYYNFQKLLITVDRQLLESRTGRERQEIVEEIILLLRELIQVTRDPHYYYQLGRLHLQESDKANAALNFRLAAEQAPEGSSYKDAAAKLAARLSVP
ncbi:hypothetical protein [Desulfuromonas sp. TF]|uniref:hypothetical protein n=1 Tax=Desulfuromonas sp. TF TaxID=1232410 RepID=UPI0003F577A2|nr:hypothetical protein [Desulfuromonas sp. TF]